ncbi:MAG: carbohydrate ABC transporter permease [Anaerolineaceae bacterium]
MKSVSVPETSPAGAIAKRRGLSDDALKRILLAPAVLIIIGLVIYPFLWAVYLSFNDYSILKAAAPVWIGAANYKDILADVEIWNRFAFTGRFVIAAVLIELVLGFGIAYFIHTRFKGKGIFVTLLMMPMMLSPVIVGLFWKYILANNWGVLNYLLNSLFGIKEILWLSTREYGFWSIVLVDVWMYTPFMMLLILAGLSSVPDYLYESAEVDRASAWFKFSRITLPLSAPLILLAVVFRIIDAFKTVDIVWVLTAGGPGSSTETIAYALYKQAFAFFQTGRASALAVILLVTVIGLSIILVRVLNRAKEATQ